MQSHIKTFILDKVLKIRLLIFVPAAVVLQIFEVSDIVILDDEKDVGAANQRHVAALYCNSNSGFEVLSISQDPGKTF